MKLFRNVLLGAILTMSAITFGYAAPLASQATPSFSGAQQAAIESIVHNYLLTHPEVIFEAVQTLQIKQQFQAKLKAQQAISKLAVSLLNDPTSPVVGNLKANISVIEFFDYRCPHCKVMQPEIAALLAHNKNVRVIYKELPIFGAESEFAAKAALAAQKQGKFVAMNDALLKANSQLTNDEVLKLAAQVGLNVAQLQKDMEDPIYAKEIANNQSLAAQIGIMGTPGFIIINKQASGMKTQFLPGQVTEVTLQKEITDLLN